MRKHSVRQLLSFLLFITCGITQDVWYIDGHETINEPIELGHVILVGNASLTISGVPDPGVRFNGNLWLLNESQLIMDSSVIKFMNSYHGQYSLAAVHQATITIRNCNYQVPSGVQHTLMTVDDATSKITDSDFDFVQILSANRSSFELARLNGRFEVLVQNESRMKVTDIPREEDSGELWVWVEFPDKCQAVYTPPMPGFTESWFFPPENSSGIFQEVELTNCQTLLWPMLVGRQVDLTLKDIPEENWVVVGFYFPAGGRVDNLHNQMYGDFTQLDLSDRKVVLDHASIDTWNCYGQKNSRLTVTNSTLGEILMLENSRLYMDHTTIDGTGGYFGATENAYVFARDCRFTCDVQVAQNAMAEMHFCELAPYGPDTTGDFTFLRAFDDSRILINQSPVTTTPYLGGNGVIGVTALQQTPSYPPSTSEEFSFTGSAMLFSLNEEIANLEWQFRVMHKPQFFKASALPSDELLIELGSGLGNHEDQILGSWGNANPSYTYELQLKLSDGWGREMVGKWPVTPQ